MDTDFTFLPKTSDVPDGADFCIIMDDAGMEPYIHSGERVFVSRRMAPAGAEIGVFRYEGKVFIRQWCEDYAGTLHLLCSNPAWESRNIQISADKKSRCLCLGKVLLAGSLSMPVYYG